MIHLSFVLFLSNVSSTIYMLLCQSADDKKDLTVTKTLVNYFNVHDFQLSLVELHGRFVCQNLTFAINVICSFFFVILTLESRSLTASSSSSSQFWNNGFQTARPMHCVHRRKSGTQSSSCCTTNRQHVQLHSCHNEGHCRHRTWWKASRCDKTWDCRHCKAENRHRHQKIYVNDILSQLFNELKFQVSHLWM